MKILINFSVVLSLLLAISCSKSTGDIKTESARHLKAAQMYLDQGQVKAAILEAKKTIQLDPKSPQGYVSLATIFNKIGAYSATQSLLESHVKEMPSVIVELSNAYIGNNKFQSAITLLNENPADSADTKAYQQWLITLATAHSYLGNAVEYQSAISKYAATNGDIVERQFVEINYLLIQNKVDDADSMLSKILQTNPDDVKALTLRGQIAASEQQYESAEQLLSKALSIVPDADIISAERIRILTLLTEVLVRQGRTSEALVYQKKLAEANPEGSAAQQRFNDALNEYQQGRFAAAEQILMELRKQFPDDKNTATLLGMVAFQKGDNDKASSLFNEFVDTETSSPSVLQVAALVKFRQNQIDDAIKLLKDAAEKQPKNATIWATYGLALLDHDNKSDEGALALEKSLALNPDNQRLRLALAKKYTQQGDVALALAQYRKAYEEKPTDLTIQQAYFKALLADNQLKKVKEEIALFKAKYSGNSRGDFIEAWFLIQTKSYSEAEAAFNRVIAASESGEKYLAYVGLAELSELRKDTQKAINFWQKAIETDPAVAAAYGRWVKVMLANNKSDEAIQFLGELEEKNAGLWQPSVMLAQVYASKKLWAEAATHVENGLKRSANSTSVIKAAADIYQLQGQDAIARNQLDEARASFLKAVKLAPDNEEFLARIVEVEIASNHLAEAQKLLDGFPKTDANNGVRKFLQGVIKSNEGKDADAIKFYQESWRAKSVEIVANNIADYYGKNKMTDQLDSFIEEWIVKLPQSAKGALLKGLKEQRLNNNESAIQWYGKTLSIAPNNLIALNNLAWLYYLQKDQRSIEMAKHAYELAPDSASIADTYGWVLVELGDVKAGLEILSRAATLDPKNKEILDHLKIAKQRIH